MNTANWIKAQDVAYAASALLLDAVVNGSIGYWSVYRHEGKWVAVFVRNGVGRQSKMFRSRKAAMEWAEAQ